jgi:hypothetical protein
MPDVDLSLVESDALVEELSQRYDFVLVVRERSTTNKHNDCLFDYSGGISACIGLAERAKHRLLSMADPIEGDDADTEEDDA